MKIQNARGVKYLETNAQLKRMLLFLILKGHQNVLSWIQYNMASSRGFHQTPCVLSLYGNVLSVFHCSYAPLFQGLSSLFVDEQLYSIYIHAKIRSQRIENVWLCLWILIWRTIHPFGNQELFTFPCKFPLRLFSSSVIPCVQNWKWEVYTVQNIPTILETPQRKQI